MSTRENDMKEKTDKLKIKSEMLNNNLLHFTANVSLNNQRIAELKAHFDNHYHLTNGTIIQKLSGGKEELGGTKVNSDLLLIKETDHLDSKPDQPNKCSECGGYRMGEYMVHNDGCSQCITTTTTAEKPDTIQCAICNNPIINGRCSNPMQPCEIIFEDKADRYEIGYTKGYEDGKLYGNEKVIGEIIKSYDLILNTRTYRFSTVGCENKYMISYPSEELIKSERKMWEDKLLKHENKEAREVWNEIKGKCEESKI